MDAGRILIIGDALNTLKPNGDSSLAMAEAALEMGWSVFWCEPSDVAIYGFDVVLESVHQLQSVSRSALPCFQPYELATSRVLPLTHFNSVWIRKDPPFDDAYKTLCWKLSMQPKVNCSNSPAALLSFHEKSLPFIARNKGILRDTELVPSCVANSVSTVKHFVLEYIELSKLVLNAQGLGLVGSTSADPLKWIAKPWLGHGGNSVQLFQDANDLFSFLEGSLPGSFADSNKVTENWIVQPFLTEIFTEGDRRVFFVKGKVVCDFVRFPGKGKIAANLAQGGTAKLVPLTAYQVELIQRIGAFLSEMKIDIAGVDLIGNRVGEINITSPTGLRAYLDLTNTNPAYEVVSRLLEGVFK
jgi:glutathione synthase